LTLLYLSFWVGGGISNEIVPVFQRFGILFDKWSLTLNIGVLAHQCYGVFSEVGLITMHIIGFSGPEAIPYAVKLGITLQLTNFLGILALIFCDTTTNW